ncbi:TOMM precursor leader peptide-binding protein [Streptomyces sp. ISL-98]|uniref:TOMM precursor leader peptide-binding protein n=1 Tax=Streptomyces sp. ISL-98 TaxID=2819192 RepID=UPI001BE66558|nr:TOMM precursor leader peptide-binding protein [Streptomyces sp. ISL-98]MBT2510126.1 TOMM precursor leader peptide-binding protein [Streptomyces sp. ISL-98]
MTGAGDGARIGFKGHFRATIVPGEAAYLVSQRGVTALHGDHAEVLVPLLDGTRCPDEVVRDAAPALTAEEALDSLRALDAAGLLRLRPAPADSPLASPCSDPAAEAYWDLAGLDGGQVSATLAHSSIRIVALAEIDVDEAHSACSASGLIVAPPEVDADLTLVLCDDYLSPGLADIDAEHRASKRPWLLARLGSTASWVGPVFRPHEGPCWNCLATRLRGHRLSEWPLRRALGLDGPPPRPHATLAAGRSLTVNLAVLEAAKWLAGVRNDAQNAVRTLDTLALTSTAHPVARLPQCAVCGDPGLVARRAGAPFVPVSRPKAVQDLNGHRALTPAQMLDRYGHLVDPVTGIIKEICRAPGSPGFVNAFLAGENLAMRSPTLAGLRAGLRALSGGKGLNEAEARTSALGEAVERYSGTRQGDEPVVRDSYAALGSAAVHPNACQLYDARQFRDRDSWNGRGSRLQYVPPRFDERRPTDWTPVWSLTQGVQRLLPTSMLYYSEEEAPDGLFADSNGNAAGSSPEDALIQGFLELVERDAVALWWYNRTRQPGIDLDAFAEPYIDRLRDGYRTLNREVWALDLTSDFGIPVVAALSRRTDKPAQDIVFGFGAHFDPRLALRRALTEMGQLLPLVANVTDQGTGYLITDAEPLDWWRRATLANQPYLSASPADSKQPGRGPRGWSYVPNTDLKEDIDQITELVRSRGMELLVLDQSRPDLELPVVKVLVPGLRHFWPRFAPGRLFNTPVTLGRCAEPTPYEQLNPIPLFV